MKLYRRLTEIKAISFDLDDTLYSNKPVMQAIEKKMIAYFTNLPILKHYLKNGMSDQHKLFNAQFWSHFRQQAILEQPDLTHDVVKIRLVTYQLGFMSLGLSIDIAKKEAQTALDYFIEQRSDFAVPEASKKLLADLSEKYTLIAISNGNVDTKTLGISQYFKHIYHAGWQANGKLLRQKPANDMFVLACNTLAIKPSQLLHIGDCGYSDIQGALRAGCQSVWLSCYDVGKPITVLPHIELESIVDLQCLL